MSLFWFYIDLFCLFNIMMLQTIGDFRVAFRLCFKASPSVKPFIWKLVLFTRKFWFIYMWIKLIFIWKASHQDSLWNRGEGNLEIAYCTSLLLYMQNSKIISEALGFCYNSIFNLSTLSKVWFVFFHALMDSSDSPPWIVQCTIDTVTPKD